MNKQWISIFNWKHFNFEIPGYIVITQCLSLTNKEQKGVVAWYVDEGIDEVIKSENSINICSTSNCNIDHILAGHGVIKIAQSIPTKKNY